MCDNCFLGLHTGATFFREAIRNLVFLVDRISASFLFDILTLEFLAIDLEELHIVASTLDIAHK